MAKATPTRLRLALTEAVRILRHGTTDAAAVLSIADVMNERRLDDARREGFQAGLEYGRGQAGPADAATLPRPRRHLVAVNATGLSTAITEGAAAR